MKLAIQKIIFRSLVVTSSIFFLNSSFADDIKKGNEPFAVVELFESEGCSSCPPADDLLREIKNSIRYKNKKIFILDFHVDYWDELGWKDPWSRRQFTKRQYHYASTKGGSSVYTPQMIINGIHAFTGSNSDKAYQNIDQMLLEPAKTNMELKMIADTTTEVSVNYKITNVPESAVLNFALVEDGLVSHVLNGENSGRTLRHTNTVQSFTVVPATQDGEMKIKKPTSLNPQNACVIAYLQNSETMEILGVSRLDFNLP